MQSSSIIRFDQYELDLGTYELRKSGRAIRLEKSPMELLVLLAEKRGQLVTREEIIHRLWGDNVFVDTRQGINTAIYKLRTALRDDPDHPRFLQTVSGRGYRLISHDASAAEEHATIAPESVQIKTVEESSDSKRKNWKLLIALLATFVAAVVGAVLGWRFHVFRPPPDSGSITSIAVLPLANLSGDPQQEYFADGMTDELITDLAKISAFRVISRTSVMRYKHARLPLPQIGRELNVDTVLEGSVVRSGNRVRITAQLVETSTDRHLWAENYERNLSDVLSLQDDIARTIATQVQAKLAPGEEARLALARTVNPEAYDLYLRGRYLSGMRGENDLDDSVAYFEQAISLDSNFAPAYASIAQSYGLLGNNGAAAPQDAYPKDKAAALKALELDPDLGDAHVALAEVLNDYEWNWPAAEEEYKRAIVLEPNNSTAHHWYAMALAWMGRSQEALAEIKQARQLDPLSTRINANVANVLYFARQYDLAVSESEKTIQLDARDPVPHLIAGLAYSQRKEYGKAIAEVQTAVALGNEQQYNRHATFDTWLAEVYAVAGKRQQALSVLMKVKDIGRHTWVSPTLIAAVYAGLGEKDEAFAWLQQALTERDPRLFILKVSPAFDPLRSDPRFNEMLRRRRVLL